MRINRINQRNKANFKKLFEPGWIGQMKVKNRIVMPPMGSGLGCGDGRVSQRMKEYYEERARGGVGLIIVEATCVEGSMGKAFPDQLLVDNDEFIAGLNELAKVIHKHGAKAAMQIHHAGRDGKPIRPDLQPVAPSPIARGKERPPREITQEEIRDLVNRFALAAERVKKAGFDGVEIHGAHEYLIADFLSPAFNRRHDNYGGSLANRARFLLEVLQVCKEAVGRDFPVWCRINGKEYLKDGLTSKEAQSIAQMTKNSGADAINVSARGYGVNAIHLYASFSGHLLPLAEAIKKVVTVPVLAVGWLTPELGEKILRQRKADFIIMGRRLIADPQLPNKVASGELEDVRPCTRCCYCIDSVRSGPLLCRVNAGIRGKPEYKLEPAEKPKRILVIGGGPAGMEAARVAKLRGHEVILCDRDSQLGGLANLAAVIEPLIEPLIDWLSSQIRKLGVKVMVGKEADQALVKEINPDVVIIATGGKSFIPQITGIESGNVVTTLDLKNMAKGCLRWADIKRIVGWQKIMWFFANAFAKYFRLSMIRWAMKLWLPFGKKVIVVGGNQAGLETARFLAERARKVTVVEAARRVGHDMAGLPRLFFITELREKGVVVLEGVKYEAITGCGLIITNKEGKKQTIETDSIALVTETTPNADLYRLLEGSIPEIYLAGDCLNPNLILGAIQEGYHIGSTI